MLLPTAALLLAIDPRGTRVDVAGGVTAEVRGGYAPLLLSDPSRPSFLTVVVPSIDFRVMRRRGTFNLGYAPRALLRQPNPFNIARPLFLHSITSGYQVAISRAWRLTAGVDATVGELDYTAANLVFGQIQSGLPDTEILSFALIGAQVTIDGRIAPRQSFAISPSATFRQALNVADERAGVLPAARSGNLGLLYAYEATQRDTVEVALSPGVLDFEPGALFFNVDARAAWRRRLRPRLASRIDAGAFGTSVIAGQDAATSASSRVLPVGGAALEGRIASHSDFYVDANINAGFLGFYDYIQGTLQPRAGGGVQVTATIPPRWSVGLNASLFTAATRKPQPEIMGQPPPIETVLLTQVPVTYRIDDTKQIEFGAIANFRMPHLRVDDFSATSSELWGYVAFRIAGGTARGRREINRRNDIGSGAVTGR